MDLEKTSILVVEDSVTLSHIVKNKLKQALDANVVIAESYQSVIDYVEATNMKFFIALSGLNLPDDPNGEVIKYLIGKNIPVVVMTRSLDADAREKLLTQNILDYIVTENIEDIDYAIKLITKMLNNKNIDILVVDDSRTARFMVKKLLNDRNYNVLEAKDGQDALDVIRENDEHDIKLVITDYNMPVMDGFELISNIRENYNKEQMGIIAISSSDNSDLSVKLLKNGANDFLIKPFHDQEFFCRVEQVVDNIINIEQIQELANRDYLTKMYNRRYFFSRFEKVYKHAKKKNNPIAIAMIDIDKFKNINDTYGHNIGDDVIANLAKILKKNFEKKASLPARLGGEEFCVLFFKSSINKIFLAMEALRRMVENQKLNISGFDEPLKYTISIGISSNLGDNIDAFINNADEHLYKAKQNGRNRIEVDKELDIKES